MQWKDPMNTSMWMKLGLISPKGEGEAVMWLAIGPLFVFLGSVVAMSHYVLPSAIMGLSTIMPTWGPTNTHQLLIFLNHMRDALLGQQDEHPIYVVVWDNVSFHRALQVREWFNMNQGFYQSLPSTVLPFPKPHWGILLLMAVEGIWTPTLHQGKSPASHGTCLWWHRCGGMPSLDTACQGFFPPLPGQTKCGLWCGWSPVAWPSTETWCCGWVMHLFVYFCTLFLHGLTVHKWQTHKISVCFYKCYV